MKKGKVKRVLSGLLVTAVAFSTFTSSVSAKTFTQDSKKVEIPKEEQLQRKVVGYFPEWAYKSEAQGYFDVGDLQWDDLTHIQYSFASVDPSTNKIAFGDKHAAIEEDFKGMNLTHKGKPLELDNSLPYKGHFNLLQTMKKQYPDVDLLISIGGWAGSRGFYTMLDTDKGIETFADSCVDFIREYGFDGVDIDFEYPSSTPQSGNPADFDVSEPRRKTINERYNVLMKTLREKLDKASTTDNKPYLLTAAVTASSWVLGGVSSNEYAKYLDFLSVMSYDFHGGWNEFVENLANIYPDPADKETINMLMPVLCMDWAYRYYRGVLPPEKIIMGIPYYTRGWENVQGGTNGLHGTSKNPATGKYNIWGDDLDNNGVLDPAGANPLWHVLNLMEEDPNLKIHWDDVGKVPYVWQNDEKVFLSFENEQSIDERVKYIKEKNLGGALIWVMNGDYGENPNYVKGSDNVNEGKYTFGNTLTKRLSNGLEKIGNCSVTKDETEGLPEIGVDVNFSGVYDHPNYTYSLKITNHTDKKIEGGWEVSFDLPKSAIYKSSWGGTSSLKDNGDFTTVTLKGGGWQGIDPGASIEVQGMIGLSFSGIRNVKFNGAKPIGKDTPTSSPDEIKLSNLVVDQKDNGSDYKLTATIPNSSNATKYILLENNKEIASGEVNPTDANFLKIEKDFKGQAPGKYNYTMKLSNSSKTVTSSIDVTVKDPTAPSLDTYDPNKIYNAGDKVIFNGKEYICKWWVQGQAPGTTDAWKES